MYISNVKGPRLACAAQTFGKWQPEVCKRTGQTPHCHQGQVGETTTCYKPCSSADFVSEKLYPETSTLLLI